MFLLFFDQKSLLLELSLKGRLLLVVSKAWLRLTLNILSNLGQTAAAECRLSLINVGE